MAVTKVLSDGKYITLDRLCIVCTESVPVTMTVQQFVEWQEGGLIQNVCSEMDAGEREMLISHICPDCWSKL